MTDVPEQLHGLPDFAAFAAAFGGLIERTADQLQTWDAARVDAPLRPGGWTPRDMLVHLVDSASNNHGRFVRAGLGGELRFIGYDQDAWVELQRGPRPPWDELVMLWRLFNRHVVRVMVAVPEDVRSRSHAEHGLSEVAWENPPEGAPGSLEFFMRDYAAHLAHHLHKLDATLVDAPQPQLTGSWYRAE
jgi:hypothetical protein